MALKTADRTTLKKKKLEITYITRNDIGQLAQNICSSNQIILKCKVTVYRYKMSLQYLLLYDTFRTLVF